jgi:hypothetical protein
MAAVGLGAALLMGCTSSPSTYPDPSRAPVASPSAPASAGSLSEAQADLDMLVEQLESIHPEPWHGVPRETFVAAVADIQERMPDLTDDQLLVEVMRLVAMISENGRDGHMFAMPSDQAAGTALPIRVYEFPDGVFVTDAGNRTSHSSARRSPRSATTRSTRCWTPWSRSSRVTARPPSRASGRSSSSGSRSCAASAWSGTGRCS